MTMTNISEPIDAVTPEQMRASIEALRRDHQLVHSCMKIADIEQMTQEDRYTMLAFTALQALARSEQARIVSAVNALPAAGGRSVLAYMATSRDGTVRFTDNPASAQELQGYGWAITPLADCGG